MLSRVCCEGVSVLRCVLFKGVSLGRPTKVCVLSAAVLWGGEAPYRRRRSSLPSVGREALTFRKSVSGTVRREDSLWKSEAVRNGLFILCVEFARTKWWEPLRSSGRGCQMLERNAWNPLESSNTSCRPCAVKGTKRGRKPLGETATQRQYTKPQIYQFWGLDKAYFTTSSSFTRFLGKSWKRLGSNMPANQKPHEDLLR